jgi:hypothetical protein
MNFVYLLVPGCNGFQTDYDGIEKIDISIKSLRNNYNQINKIYIYSGYDDFNYNKLEKYEKYCIENNLIFVNFGKLKHLFKKSNRNSPNPFQLAILIEKLYILKNHSIDEEICYVDIDTEFNQNMQNYIFDLSKPIMHAKEYNLFNNYRHINKIFEAMNKNYDKDFYMFNSGIIYIPKNMRIQIAQKAIDLVIKMNNYDENLRICNRLDEQIAISFYINKYYKNNINILEKCVQHYWASSKF